MTIGLEYELYAMAMYQVILQTTIPFAYIVAIQIFEDVN